MTFIIPSIEFNGRFYSNDYITKIYIPYLYTNVSSEITFTAQKGSKIEYIDYQYISGSPIIKIGSVSGGEDLILSETISTTVSRDLDWNFDIDTILYLGVSGGIVNIVINYKERNF
jgi:hypothetical protein